VNTLLQVKKQNGSLQYALPILAAYLGHSHYTSTSVYLRVADAMSRNHLVDVSLWKKRKQ
jgi:hypothetical protein